MAPLMSRINRLTTWTASWQQSAFLGGRPSVVSGHAYGPTRTRCEEFSREANCGEGSYPSTTAHRG
jgi:hypothetical protein